MAQIVKLRRSSVSGQKPTNSNLQLGELALNTTDGKVYMAKSGSLGPSVEELISTNTVNTGSINLIGAISASQVSSSFIGDGSGLYNIPLSGVTNLVTISGSFDDRLDSLEAYSGSQLVPSSSMSFRTLQTDVYCKNITGAQINKGTVVRIVGSTGDNPLIGVADPTSEEGSANVLGIATVNIPNDDFGLVITEGVLTGVNTNGMTAGALLFLGLNGTFTTTPPTAPNHGVRLGEVLRIQQNQGSIYVRVDNGIELNEAHDVIYTGITHGDLLVRSGSLWKNSKSLEGDYVVTGSLTVTQNLTVLGSSSLVYVTSSQLAVSASFISVNVFEPAERFGGLKVYDSGSSNATASLAWDSQHNHWVYQNVDGASYSGGMLLSGPRNSGSLGDEPGLIDGRIVKSIGGDHLDVSIISETGTTINIDGNLVANSITGSFDFFGLINRPTLVSGSSQIEITGTTGYSTFSSSIKDSIDVVTGSITDLSSSIATTTNLLDERIDSLETESGSIRSDFNSFTSSYTTGAFTGSFIGDGIGLYNIPASGVTGLQLDKIVSGNASASIDNTGLYVNRDVYIDGTLTAKELHIDYVTSSVLYQSGSTKFGDTSDDTHNFTGSVFISGSFNLHGNQSVTGSLLIGTGSFHVNNPEILHVQNSGSFNVAHFEGDYTAYTQIKVQNHNSGSGASGDVVITADNGNESIHYVDLGINSSTYDEGYVGYANDAYLINAGKDLYVGTLGGIAHPSNLNLFAQSNWQNPQIQISGSKQISFNTGSVSSGYTYEFSGSIKAGHNLNVLGYVTANEFTGSALGLTNVPFHITGSDVDGGTYDKQFTKLHFDDSTGLNVSESVPGTAFISIGSHFRDIFVSGSGMLRATGSDAFEVVSEGGVDITVSNTDTNTNGYTKELKFSTTNLSSSLNDRVDIITGSFESFTSSFSLFSGSVNTHISALDNFTSSVVYTSQTSSMTVLSASYALTAAFALNAGSGGSGGSGGGFAELNQTTPSTTWTFNHNLGQKYPIFQIFDTNDNVIIPSQITAVTSDSATITFPSAQSGRAIASLGTGPGGMTEQFSAATTWSISHNMGTDYPIVTVYDNNRKIIFPQEIRSIDGDNIEVYFSAPVAGHLNVAKGGHIISGSIDTSNINFSGSTIVSSSAQISGYGYATTGSNVFNGNQTINGCLTINNAKMCATTTTISGNAEIFDLGSFDGAFFDYVVKNGSNMRAGSIMSAWDGTNSTFNETTTIDLGNTTAVGFNVSGAGKLNATISSGTWTIEVLYRALGDQVIAQPTPTPTSTPMVTPTPTSTPTITATPTPTATSSGPQMWVILDVYSGSSAGNVCTNINTGAPFNIYVSAYTSQAIYDVGAVWYTNQIQTTFVPVGFYRTETTGITAWYQIGANGVLVAKGYCASTTYQISTGSTAPDYCSGLFGQDQTVYGNASDWLEVTRFFTNSSLVTPFNGNNKYYGNSTADYGTTLRIDSNGFVINQYAC
jgi:hypothetical protein